MDRDRDTPLLTDVGPLDIEDDERLLVNTADAAEDYDEQPAVEFDLGAARSRRPRHATPAVEPDDVDEADYDDEDDEAEPGPAPRRTGRPSRPAGRPEAQTRVLEITEEQYQAARRLALAKFAFLRTALLLIAINGIFFAASWLQLEPSGRYWFVWPASLSLVALVANYVRIFLFAGQDLRTIMERRIERMTQAEVRRAHRF